MAEVVLNYLVAVQSRTETEVGNASTQFDELNKQSDAFFCYSK